MSRSVIGPIACLACVCLASLGCADTSSCDPDQDFVGGRCVTRAPGPTDGGPAPDATLTCEDGGVEGGTDFGAVCVDSAGCGCPAPFCSVQPGATEGMCTQSGCVEDPSLCPAGWRCFDLSLFMAGLPSICIED